MPGTFRAYRTRKTGDSCRIYKADQETPPGHLQESAAPPALPEEIEKVIGTEDELTGDVLSEKDIKKERVCPHCGEQQLKINFEKPTTFSEVQVEEARRSNTDSLLPI